jgi:hypothetical protein
MRDDQILKHECIGPFGTSFASRASIVQLGDLYAEENRSGVTVSVLQKEAHRWVQCRRFLLRATFASQTARSFAAEELLPTASTLVDPD